MDTKPLLLLDVDGPLNPFLADTPPPGYVDFAVTPTSWGGPPLPVVLNPGHGPALLALADVFDLVWATAWEDGANADIAPLIGLPSLPVIEFGIDYEKVRDDAIRFGVGNRLHWKSPAVAAYTAGRPFVWFDDELSVLDEEFFAGGDLPCALRRIDPARGLTTADLAAARAWAETTLAGSGNGRIEPA